MLVYLLVLGSYQKAIKKHSDWVNIYENYSHPKVVLQIENEDKLVELYEKAKSAQLPCYLVVDAGRTQIAPNSKTVVGIGPG